MGRRDTISFESGMERWFKECRELDAIHVPWCLKEEKKVWEVTINTFSDASKKVYAAASYVHPEYGDGMVSTRLVAAKSRLAPLRLAPLPNMSTLLKITLMLCGGLLRSNMLL